MVYCCKECQKTFDIDSRNFRCTCGAYLDLVDVPIFPLSALDKRGHTIWRYREAFGLPEAAEPVSLGEGFTPLIQRKMDGHGVHFKMDFRQPSGSFKDRGMSVVMSLARYLGVKSVVEDSSGNAGTAVSAYSATCDIACTIFVPSYTPEGKTVQASLYGAKVVRVPGLRQDANDAAIKAAEKSYYASHLWNPFFMMGLKSAAYEIWESMGRRSPDQIIVPLGGGGNLEGIYLGFESLFEAGYTTKIPRMIGVQAEKCSPIHQGFQKGLEDYLPVKAEKTVAEGIAVSQPPRAKGVIEAIRKSGGRSIAVTEDEILSATRELFQSGLYTETTSAAAYAGWKTLQDRDNSVLVLTGTALKQTEKLAQLFL